MDAPRSGNPGLACGFGARPDEGIDLDVHHKRLSFPSSFFPSPLAFSLYSGPSFRAPSSASTVFIGRQPPPLTRRFSGPAAAHRRSTSPRPGQFVSLQAVLPVLIVPEASTVSGANSYLSVGYMSLLGVYPFLVFEPGHSASAIT